MKIAILGAGAMGCFTAAHLCGKNQVTLIDSYLPQVEAVREHGVTVTHLDGSETVCRIPICESGKCTEVPDLLIVFVKATATDAALAANASVIGKDTLVLSLQNGMEAGEVARLLGHYRTGIVRQNYEPYLPKAAAKGTVAEREVSTEELKQAANMLDGLLKF